MYCCLGQNQTAWIPSPWEISVIHQLFLHKCAFSLADPLPRLQWRTMRGAGCAQKQAQSCPSGDPQSDHRAKIWEGKTELWLGHSQNRRMSLSPERKGCANIACNISYFCLVF